MKKIIFSFLLIGTFAIAGTALAQVGMMGNYGQYGGTTLTPPQSSEVNSVLQDIYKTQNIDSQAKVDCSKVTDDQFNTLGDAYMGVMLPNQQQHEAMDNMMGGEGSASLRQAHINMGRSYLGCWSNYNSGPVYMPMMGGYGIMNELGAYNNNYPGGIMGGYGSGWNMMGNWGFGGWVTTVLVWVLLILGIVAAVKWLRKK